MGQDTHLNSPFVYLSGLFQGPYFHSAIVPFSCRRKARESSGFVSYHSSSSPSRPSSSSSSLFSSPFLWPRKPWIVRRVPCTSTVDCGFVMRLRTSVLSWYIHPPPFCFFSSHYYFIVIPRILLPLRFFYLEVPILLLPLPCKPSTWSAWLLLKYLAFSAIARSPLNKHTFFSWQSRY